MERLILPENEMFVRPLARPHVRQLELGPGFHLNLEAALDMENVRI